MPVFNCTDHFKFKNEGTRLKPEEVLTQRAKVDPFYNSEIPVGALVAVHSTISTYNKVNRPNKSKWLSFNLIAVQLLALPNEAS